MHGRFLLYLGREDEAITEMKFAWGANHPKALAHLGKFLYYAGRLDEASRAFAQALAVDDPTQDPSVTVLSAYLYASRGERQLIQPSFFSQEPDATLDGDQAYWTGGVYALLDEKETALLWFRRAVDLGNHNYPWFIRDRNYDRLRGNPDYERLLERVRLAWEHMRRLFG
jgi:tetratricopeptide (TPR) repeat protein